MRAGDSFIDGRVEQGVRVQPRKEAGYIPEGIWILGLEGYIRIHRRKLLPVEEMTYEWPEARGMVCGRMAHNSI